MLEGGTAVNSGVQVDSLKAVCKQQVLLGDGSASRIYTYSSKARRLTCYRAMGSSN